MAEVHRFLAFDLGAESGRGEIVTLRGGKVEMEEIHRFANRPVRLGKTLHWDFPSLFAEILAAMKICSDRGETLAGVSVDTWGVDFGLLGPDDMLLGNPVHYRDRRTENIHDYSDKIMSRDDVFATTGCEPWSISSLFQLLSMQRDGSPLLDVAETFLNMPDLCHFFLTGVKATELSIASTSGLLATDRSWAGEIFERFNLRRGMFKDLIAPATVLGQMQGSVCDEVGLGDVPVIATCGHDTSAAVAAVPGTGNNWAFLSCGTWSIMGAMIDQPIATKRCLELGFSNEYTVGSWFLAANLLGLWLVQQLRSKWDTPDDPWDYNRMTAEAENAEPSGVTCFVDTADDSLLAPPDMEEALLALIRRDGQSAPASRGQLLRCVLESLALEYALRLDALSELTGRRYDVLNMVGGGIANKVLCQFSANACGIPVYAGADQCTAMGNALCQALALGILTDREQIREVMRNSFELSTYEPREQSLWEDMRAGYRRLKSAAK